MHLKQAMSAIRAYEYELSRALLDVLEETPGVTVYGLTERRRLEERAPTVSFTHKSWSPRRIAEALDEANIYVWDGNYYALAVTERLGVEESGGMVRVGPAHYNTVEEIERFGEALLRPQGLRVIAAVFLLQDHHCPPHRLQTLDLFKLTPPVKGQQQDYQQYYSQESDDHACLLPLRVSPMTFLQVA